MKKVKFHIIASIDGYIAYPWDDDIKWFSEFPNPSKNDYGYKEFFDSTDTVIMDELVYNEILSLDVIWPYKDKVTYVISRFERRPEENVRFITNDIAKTVSSLKQQPRKDIWLIGDIAISQIFDQSDEMQLVYIPIIHGNDKPLFSQALDFSLWTLSENIVYDNGALRLTYQRK